MNNTKQTKQRWRRTRKIWLSDSQQKIVNELSELEEATVDELAERCGEKKHSTIRDLATLAMWDMVSCDRERGKYRSVSSH